MAKPTEPMALEYVTRPAMGCGWSLLIGFSRLVWLLVKVPPLGAAVCFGLWTWSWYIEHRSAYLPAFLVFTFVAVLLIWRQTRPASYARLVSRPVIGRWRRVFLYGRWWQPAMVTSGLVIRPWTQSEVLPTIGRVKRTATGDVLVVGMLPGQTVKDWNAAAPALAQTFAATSCRVRSHPTRPQLVILTFTTRDALAAPVEAFAPTPVETLNLEAVPVAVTEDGGTYSMPVLYAHTLVAGETGSGKGSVLWSLLAGVAPAIQSGHVQVWALDPKGGMELGPGSALFARFACGAPVKSADGGAAPWQADMVDLLEDAVGVMQARAARLRGVSRKHVPTVGEPLILVVIDELAALTSYVTDSTLKKRLTAAIGLLLSQGRAVGVSVVGATQDARKETLAFRDLFSRRIALRTAEAEMADLILGSGAHARGAETDAIDPRTPGVAYVACDGIPEPVRVRFTNITDADIAGLAHAYRPLWAPAYPPAPGASHVQDAHADDAGTDDAPTGSTPDAPTPDASVWRDERPADPTSPPDEPTDPRSFWTPTPPPASERRPRAPRKPRTPRASTRDRGTPERGEAA